MHSGPVSTYIAIAAIMIYCLAFAIRIFERPYFTFNFVDAGVIFYNFEYLTSILWYTIITMTTVGYGNIYATTPIGRFFAIVAVIVGAFLLSLMVAIITSWFNMDEKRTVAINKMERDRFSAECVRICLQYNIARSKRYRLLSSGNEDNEHIATVQELTALKEKMYAAVIKFKNANAALNSDKE